MNGFLIALAMTVLTVIAMVTDLHDLHMQIKANDEWINTNK